jgi:predicted alpha/beta hydrolase
VTLRPSEPGLDQLSLTRAEGTRFALTIARATNADGTTPVVVVQPAMGMKARYYGAFATALAEAGVHAVVVEQRGHEAEGGRLPGRDYDFGYAELLEDLDAAMATVREQFPGAPIHLLGHSLGGQVAVMYAGLHPDALAGIVLVAASTPHWPHWGPRLLVASYVFPLAASVVGHFPGAQLKFAGREARGLMREWGRLARTGRFVAGESGLPTAALPVLVVSIEDDWLGPIAAVDALAAKLPAATVSRVHVDEDGIDHFRWARQPEPVVPLVTGWLRTVGATP